MLIGDSPALIARQNITGLILAGGQSRRMGGIDKGLACIGDMPLALHAARRLAPQVGRWAINANRHLAQYATWGAPVWTDHLPPDIPAYPGPLAGFLAGLHHCESDYLVTVPCDVPWFPTDLVERLGKALTEQDADLAMATTLGPQGHCAQPVFCLMKKRLAPDLSRFLRAGQHKVTLWAAEHLCAKVPFEDEEAFFNVNTPLDLQQAALRANETRQN